MNNGYQCVLIEHELATECRTDGTDTSSFIHTRHFLCILNNHILSSHDPISSKMGLIIFFYLVLLFIHLFMEITRSNYACRIVMHIQKRHIMVYH